MSSQGPRRRGDPSPPVKLEIVDVEKRKGLSKYYAYVIDVTCKDGSKYTIYRRYRQFDEIHNCLEKRFPIEAGAISSKDRTLPNLPGKILFGRSAVRDVTEKRAPQLNFYLKKLFALPDKICNDSIVLAFVKPTPDDQQTTTRSHQPYKNRTNGVVKPDRPAKPAGIPLPAKPRQHLDKPSQPSIPVPKPNHLRSTAQAPPFSRSAPPLSRPAPPPKPAVAVTTRGPRARALYKYSAQHGDELSFTSGESIRLVRRMDGDWWEGHVAGETGLVPGNYIEVIQPPVTEDPKDSIQSSDEWESSDEDVAVGKLTYYFNGAARTVEVDTSVIQQPTVASLQSAIRSHLHRTDTVLNYKDSSRDLVQIVDESDIILLKREGIPPRKTSDAPWAIYVTVAGDNSVYHLDPHK